MNSQLSLVAKTELNEGTSSGRASISIVYLVLFLFILFIALRFIIKKIKIEHRHTHRCINLIQET